jgi:predicted nucleic acid-binding Zn ribbon protein
VTEVFQPITDKPRRKLKKDDDPQCDCNAGVQRLIGRGGGIIFKGSGFYETDYRSDSYKKDAEADKPKTESKDDGKKKEKKSKPKKKAKSNKGN